jgi:hypothetical protein
MKRAILIAVVFLAAGCSPVEQQARDALAASQGFIMQAQQNHQAECSQTPKKSFPCAMINQAVGAQNLAIDALEVYCGWTAQDVQDAAAGKSVHPCFEAKTAMDPLKAALSNLNQILKDYKLASGGTP